MPLQPLSAGARGDDVSSLHASLQRTGFQLPASEVSRTFFGPATRRALRDFQTARKLNITGVLDAATAAALEAGASPAPLPAATGVPQAATLLRPELLAAASPATAVVTATTPFVVRGQVSVTDGRPLPGVTVVVVDQDLRGQELLGPRGVATQTDPDGRYEVTYTAAQFARAEKNSADLVVWVLNSANAIIGVSGIPLFNAPQTATINVTVAGDVTGLASEYERLVAELRPLVVNVVIAGNPQPDVLLQLADLKEGDIDFLIGETGESRAKIVALVTSAILEIKSISLNRQDIPAAAFYGLARQGVSLDTAGLIAQTVDQLQAALDLSVQGNVIPPALGEPVPQLAQDIHNFAISQLLQTSPPPGASSIAQTLSLSGIDAGKQATLLSLAIQNTDSPQQFWDQLRSQSDFKVPGLVDRIQLTMQLGALTQNHAPLIQQVLQTQISSLKDLVKLDVPAWTELLSATVNGQPVGVPPGVPGNSPHEQALNYASGMAASVRAAFPTETMVHLASVTTGLPVQSAVATFFSNASDFDIRATRVDAYIAQNSDTLFHGIAEADRPQVVQQVKRLQRVFHLSTNADSAAALLATPLDSAHAVARMPLGAFLGQYAVSLGGEQVATQIYQRSQIINARSLLVFSAANEALNGIQPAALGADQGHARESLLKVIPNYEELFGSLDLCQCEDCRSILSPAAYLVDLFQFLRYSWPNDNGKSALDILFSRRPDLPYLPLTCENTNTAMPYIDLVNEVLESYILLSPKNQWNTYQGYDTGSTPTAVLDSSPQETNDAAYAILHDAVYPATLPFNLPVETARVYLENLGSSRHEVITLFQKKPGPMSDRGAAAEFLGISREEFQIIAKADFDPAGTIPVRDLCQFYGYPPPPPANWESDVCQVPNFLARTGIAYTDLIQLVTTSFINPDYPSGDALKTFLLIPISFAALTALVAAGFVDPDPAIVAAVTDALGSWKALTDWVDANYASLTKLIVLDAPDGGCDLASIRIVHLDGTGLTDTELDKLHRMIRLWRKLGWSIADVDRAMTALSAADITPDFVVQLARIQQLQNTLAPRTLQQLFSLWGDINVRGDDSLYAQLFLSKSDQDAAFLPAPSGAVLPPTTAETLDDHIPALLAALRVRASDLDAIRADASLGTAATLTLANVSTVYRYALLGQLLKLRIPDLLPLKALSGIDPFSAPATTIQFQALSAAVQQSGSRVAQLTWLYRHLSPPPADLSPQPAEVRSLAQSLHRGLMQIQQDNVAAPDPSGELSRTKLMVLFDNSTVEAAIGMINGSAIYSSSLAALPAGIVFPDLVKQKTSYDAVNQALRFEGAMTNAEQAALAGAAPAAATAYQASVADLYQQPVTFLHDSLSGFLDETKATTALLRTTASLDPSLNPVLLDSAGAVTTDPAKAVTTAIAAKFEYLLSQLLPALIAQQSHVLVKQTMAAALQLDTAVAQVLLESILTSQADPKQPAIADFLALSSGGLTVDYFATPGLTGSSSRPATPVDFSTPIPAGTQSARWTGVVQTLNTGTYTLIVESNGTPQLWLDETAQTLTKNPQTGEWSSAQIPLNSAKSYDLRLEATALPASGAVTVLRWKNPILPKQTVPADNLYAAAQLDYLTATLTCVRKAALIVNTFKLGAAEIQYFSTSSADFGGFDLNALPLSRDAASAAAIDANAPKLFQSWQRLYAYVTLRNAIPQGTVTLLDVFSAPDPATATLNLAAATGWKPEELAAVAGPSGFNLAAADFHNEVALVSVQSAIGLIDRLGLSASQLFAWADLTTAFADLQSTIAPDIKKTVQGKYDPDSWLALAKSLNDTLRREQRDALVAYLLPLLGLSDVNQLLEFFLIDAAMGSCMETSRIKQAISSTQFFVQRCLLNLESELDTATGRQVGVPPWAIDETQWKNWRSRYSTLWAPAREVFVYPENWLFSELRDDKSPFFKQFESALLQNEITAANAETAYLQYLQSLDQVARLEICGSYWESVDPSTGQIINTLHVFGHTRQDPKAYFYRSLAGTVWTAWERVTTDIQGDHLIPVVWNRRLLLFWPTYTQYSNPPASPDTVDPTKPIPVRSSQPYLKIGLAWSEYKQGKWSPKCVTDQTQFLVGPDDSGSQDPSKFMHYNYVFRTEVLYDARGFPADLLIHGFFCGTPEFWYSGTFDIGGCAGDTINVINIWPGSGFAWDSPRPTGADFDAMTYAENPTYQGLSMVGTQSNTPILFLNRSVAPYNLLYPHQGGLYRLQLPFFYEDGAVAKPIGGVGASPRTFLATPSITLSYITFRDSDKFNLSQYVNSINTKFAATAIATPALPEGVLRNQAADRLRAAALTTAALSPTVPNVATIGTSPVGASLSPSTTINPIFAVDWAAQANAIDYHWSPINNYIGWIIYSTSLTFDNHYHPFVCEFLKALTRQGVAGLLSETTQTLGVPYTQARWLLGFWKSGPQTWVTSIAEGVSGPASMIQSDFGIGDNLNFEAAVLQGSNLVHYWKDNSVFGFANPWQVATVAGAPDIVSASATGPASLLQSDYDVAGTGHGRFEVIVQEGSNLVHYSRYGTAPTPGWTRDLNVISSSVTGPGSMVQSYRLDGGNGRFEVVALEGTDLVHYWQDNSHPVWQRAGVITANARSAGFITQSFYLDASGVPYLEVVVCQGPSADEPYDLMHYTFDGSAWSADPYVSPGLSNSAQIITSRATGAASMIQSDILDGHHANFEVVVPEGNNLVHYWRDNANPSLPWQQGQVISARATGPACIIQSSFGREGMYRGNFEVAALEGSRLVHFWLSNADRFFFSEEYRPAPTNVLDPYPVEDVDFRYTGAYSIYNWEIFFHAPLLIANKLCANQRYEDALTWIKYILNLTDDSLNEAPPGRYWKFIPFKNVPQMSVTEMMLRLDRGDPDLIAQIFDWANHPFEPFRIARLRPSAFQKNVLMACWDILIGWGDYLFRQNTIESINLAEQFYVLVADSQGPGPQAVPARGVTAPMNYSQLKDKLDAFSNALVGVENVFPFSGGVPGDPVPGGGGLLGVSDSLYFCIPQNAKLLSYWDTIADRLYKIRNCMNISGVRQQLPLFEPILDPALLVQAAAQGVDIGSVLSDINSPLPYYRFSYVVQKALDLAGECRSFGGALLSALEKNDAEALGLLRATQETQIQGLTQQLKTWQHDEAVAEVAALQQSRDNAASRYIFYQTLITGTAPPSPPLNATITLLPTPAQPIVTADSSALLKEEQDALDSSHSARDWKVRASTMETLASLSHYIPQFHAHVDFWGLGIEIQFGGQHVGPALSAIARYQQNLSDQDSFDSSHADTMARYFRRQQEWTLQSNVAAGEIMQIDKQISSANVRAAIAYYDQNFLHPAQQQNAQAVQDFLTNKLTNQILYAWTISDLSTTYFQCYQLAYDLARQAERTYRFERGLTDSNFIQFGYWDSLHKGLQSGERLYLAIKQMERAYQDQNKREYEITKRISLLLTDPIALISLKETGQCTVNLPEQLFDSDYPGHYMRRIRSVGLTIPCVTGPYTSVNCTLTLLKSKIRFDSNPQPAYPEQDNDPRFIYNFAATQSIATSTAQNDSGMFEVNFHDERYLPFEGAGAISQWRLEMPLENNAFDFESIADVAINLLYTARDAGSSLKQSARNAPNQLPDDAVRMFSVKHEFATEWSRFLRPPDTAAALSLALNLTIDRFPYMYRGKVITIDRVELFLIFRDVYDRTVYKLDPKNPSPLGDYGKGTPLTLRLVPPGGTEATATIKCDSLYGGVPHGVIDLSSQTGSLGSWQLSATDADILPMPASLRTTVSASGSVHQRLIVETVSDLIVVCHYSIS